VAVGDQLAAEFDELVLVVGPEAVGDVDIGVVAEAAEKLRHGAAGSLADDIPERDVDAGQG